MAATGMPRGAQVVQPLPAAIVTSGTRPKVPRGGSGTGASVRWRHGSGPARRRWRARAGLWLPQCTGGLVRQARTWLGLAGALALGRRRPGRGGQTWLGPHDMPPDEAPYENGEGQLVDKKR
jgi:hypothetical protein